MPKISIVLPTYNGEQHLRESIESILHQTFSDWELIIVDDCSTDSTPVIAEQYAAEDGRIKVIHNKENRKLPGALNIGFEHSVGEFLTWTSDDNVYLPDALRRMREYLMKQEDVPMVCACAEMVDASGNQLEMCGNYDEAKIFDWNCVGACFLYRRKVLEEIGGYNEEMFLVEDYDYWLRILKRYGKIGHINEILYVYRRHEKSLSVTKKKQVALQLRRLRRNLFHWMLETRKDQKQIARMYYEMMQAQEDMTEFEEQIYAFVSELEIEKAENGKIRHGISGGIAVFAGIIADRIVAEKQYESRLENATLRADKLQEFYDLLLLWLELKQKGCAFHKYFEENRYKSVAIYGMRELGWALCRELDGMGVDVKYLIDRNADSIYSEKKIYLPGDELPDVDVIIVTALHYYDEIKREMSAKVKCPVVNLADVVHETLARAIGEEGERSRKVNSE